MRLFLLSSLLIFISISCNSVYSKLHKGEGDPACISHFKPAFESTLYTIKVDVTGKHITGLLLFKKLPDSSMRVVFSSELGFKFFDFGFTRDSGFKVYYILKQMDKKPLIKALRKDFELVLFEHTGAEKAFILKDSILTYYGFPQEKGNNYYVTDKNCNDLVRIEKSSKRKVIVEAIMKNYKNGIPDTINISHKKFQFDIALKRIIK